MHQTIRATLATIATWASITSLAWADQPAKPTVALDFARLGFSSVPTVSDTSCDVAMNLNEAAFQSTSTTSRR